jgi:hypothetical protein
MRVGFIRLAVALTVLATPVAAHAFERPDPVDPLRIADLLFPETAHWPRFEDLPATDPKLPNPAVGELFQLQDSHRFHDPAFNGSGECGFPMRVSSDPKSMSLIRRLEIPENPALIYSGSAHCREGDVTVAWRKLDDAYGLVAFDFPFLVLRTNVERDLRFSVLNAGCCADPMDHYLLIAMTRGHPKRLQDVASAKWLAIPNGATEDRHPRRFDQETVLRLSPEVDDAYDESESRFLNVAAFGNIARKYLAGIEVTQLLSYRDAEGSEWALILVPTKYDARSFYTALPVNLGWIKP